MSSATTSFQIATNGGSGSDVNGDVPPRGQCSDGRRDNDPDVHMVIHRLWITDTGHCVVADRVRAAVPALVTVVDTPWARGWAAIRTSRFSAVPRWNGLGRS